MGANGSGKTQLLRALSHTVLHKSLAKRVVYVEGGRSTEFDLSVGVDGNTLNLLNNPGQSEIEYLHNRTSNLSVRMRTALKLIRALETDRKVQHSDAMAAWVVSGQIGNAPVRAELPFDRLARLFHAVFQDLELFITPNLQIYVRRGDIEYPSPSMSDGEKQIFMLIADLLSMSTDESIIIVDEPELNLHPTLAENFWSMVEAEFESSVFVYATHSIAFALRANVEKVIVLGYGNIEQESLFNHEQAAPFLGSIIRVVSKKQCLLVEGNDSSVDLPLYRWLSSYDNFSVVPLGGSSEVALAAAREGLWTNLASTVKVTGVVDRDFKPAQWTYKNCIMLPFHEAESLLCHPDLVVMLQEKLSNRDRQHTVSEIIELIAKECSSHLLQVVSRRVFCRLTINLGVSAEKSKLAGLTDMSALVLLVQDVAKSELVKAQTLSDPEEVKKVVEDEFSRCSKAVEGRDVGEMLRIFEGKRILRIVLPLSGCQSVHGMIKAVQKHLNPADFPFMRELTEQLREVLA